MHIIGYGNWVVNGPIGLALTEPQIPYCVSSELDVKFTFKGRFRYVIVCPVFAI